MNDALDLLSAPYNATRQRMNKETQKVVTFYMAAAFEHALLTTNNENRSPARTANEAFTHAEAFMLVATERGMLPPDDMRDR